MSFTLSIVAEKYDEKCCAKLVKCVCINSTTRYIQYTTLIYQKETNIMNWYKIIPEYDEKYCDKYRK